MLDEILTRDNCNYFTDLCAVKYNNMYGDWLKRYYRLLTFSSSFMYFFEKN